MTPAGQAAEFVVTVDIAESIAASHRQIGAQLAARLYEQSAPGFETGAVEPGVSELSAGVIDPVADDPTIAAAALQAELIEAAPDPDSRRTSVHRRCATSRPEECRARIALRRKLSAVPLMPSTSEFETSATLSSWPMPKPA